MIRRMAERSLLLLLVALSVSCLCEGTQVRGAIPPDPQTKEQQANSFPVDILGLSDEESVGMMFGMQLFNGIHDRLTRCREKRQKIEAKYVERSRNMHQYFHDTEEAIGRGKQQFEKLMHDNVEAIEENFQNVFRQLRKSREKELDKLTKECNKTLDVFVQAQLQEAVRYAESLIIRSPAEYTKLTFDVSSFGTRLRGTLAQCRTNPTEPHPPAHSQNEGVNADNNGEMHFDLCYIHEIETMVDFIDQFLIKTDELTRQYYRDDEDTYYDQLIGGSGDFEEKEGVDYDMASGSVVTETVKDVPVHRPTPHPTEQDTLQKVPISGFFEPGPVILGGKKSDDKHEEEKTELPAFEISSIPTEAPEKHPDSPSSVVLSTDVVVSPTMGEVPSPSTEYKPEDQGDSHDDADDEKDAEKSTDAPGIGEAPLHPESKPTPAWVDDAFDDVLGHMKKDGKDEERGEIDEKSPKTAAHSRSKEEEEEPQHHGSIDLNLPGVNVEIDSGGINVETKTGEGDGQKLSIVFEDDQVETTASSSEDEEDSFIMYMLIYFFATLGSLLLVTVFILSVSIVVLRMRKTMSNYKPLLSEEEKIAVMKQTGYVNPTYKFFDRAKDV